MPACVMGLGPRQVRVGSRPRRQWTDRGWARRAAAEADAEMERASEGSLWPRRGGDSERPSGGDQRATLVET
eukprot:3324567-Rhodomonas_salina.5